MKPVMTEWCFIVIIQVIRGFTGVTGLHSRDGASRALQGFMGVTELHSRDGASRALQGFMGVTELHSRDRASGAWQGFTAVTGLQGRDRASGASWALQSFMGVTELHRRYRAWCLCFFDRNWPSLNHFCIGKDLSGNRQNNVVFLLRWVYNWCVPLRFRVFQKFPVAVLRLCTYDCLVIRFNFVK